VRCFIGTFLPHMNSLVVRYFEIWSLNPQTETLNIRPKTKKGGLEPLGFSPAPNDESLFVGCFDVRVFDVHTHMQESHDTCTSLIAYTHVRVSSLGLESHSFLFSTPSIGVHLSLSSSPIQIFELSVCMQRLPNGASAPRTQTHIHTHTHTHTDLYRCVCLYVNYCWH